MGNTKLLQRVIFTLIALSFTSSLFASSWVNTWEINPVANDEVVTLEEVYAAYCNSEEFRALAKKVRDGASFIPFVEEALLNHGYEYSQHIDFGGIVLDKNSTKEEIQQEIDKYKRNVKFHRANLVEYLDIFFSKIHLEKNSVAELSRSAKNKQQRDSFYKTIKIMKGYDYTEYTSYHSDLLGFCPKRKTK